MILPSYLSTVFKSVSMNGEQLMILSRSLRNSTNFFATSSLMKTTPAMSRRIIFPSLPSYWEQRVSNSEYEAAVRVPSKRNLTVLQFSVFSVIRSMNLSLLGTALIIEHRWCHHCNLLFLLRSRL